MSENNSLKKNQIGAVISYVNVAASIVVGLLVTPAIIKGLGDSEYGVYVLIASITSYLSVVQNGFSDTTIRYATKFRARDDKEQAARFNGFSLCVNIVITILALLIGILLASKFPVIYGNSLSAEEISIAVRLLYLMLINIAITFMSNVFFGYLAAYEEFVLLRGLELANTIISYTLIYVVLLLGAGAYEIVLVTTFCNLVVALIEVC
ncbi:MAG: hypothetical protein LIO93_12880, partial [Bacteroidales bacterium]|nr:hypothetical protein [Bacteroidales bacterium]